MKTLLMAIALTATFTLNIAAGSSLNMSALDATATNFTRGANNPSLQYRATSWYQNAGFDASRVLDPTVINHNGTYLMFYGGMLHWNPMEIGLATSSDGETFSRYSTNPIIPNDQVGWADFRVTPGAIFDEGSQFRMFVYGDDRNSYAIGQIGYATSPDGYNWTIASSPVVTNTNTWYDSSINANRGVNLVEVVRLNGEYLMYYNIKGIEGLYLTRSSDGVSFDVDPYNRVMVPTDFRIGSATVVNEDATPFILATGWNTDGEQVFAASLDGLDWQIGTQPIEIGALDVDNQYREMQLTTLMIEDGVLKAWGERSVGDVTWSYGNTIIEYASVTEPDWDVVLSDTQVGSQVVPAPGIAAGLVMFGSILGRLQCKRFRKVFS